ncbi:MAG: M1 family metallopeptidase, partial [Acidobacteria bacterium]|nr:M1 family metallopeptidase [Acidobacteriota bacterium]
MRAVPAWLLIFPALAHAGQASEIARAIRELELDPAACHRVRDLVFSREDARFYLTDGYLIFARPLAGSPVAAVFAAAADGGDAEVLLLPPLGSERRSLASHTGAPNLSEHFDTAVLVFSDHTYRELRALIAASPASRPAPDVGMLLSENWTPVLRNIATSFETRLVFDLLSQVPEQEGFFNAAIRGRTRGNFDVHFDPRSREQIRAGQLNSRQDRTFFDVWTSFAARSWRNGLRHPFPPAFRLEDFRIEAVLDPGLRLDVVTRVKVAPAGIVRVLPFDISARMEVSAVTVDGRPAEVLQRESLRSNLIRNTGNNLFLIVPPAPLEPGRTYELEFRHSGSVVTRAPGGVYYVGSRANWYPNSGPGFATYDLAFRYPRDLDLVAGGELVEEKSEGEWRQSRHRIASPVRLAGFNLGRYERVRVERAGYVVDVYAPR